MDIHKMENREQKAKQFMLVTSILGFIVMLAAGFQAALPFSWSIFLLLVTFLFITEFFAIPVWKGATTLGFPIVFTMDLLFGLPLTLVVYGVVILCVNALQKRSVHILSFNAAQLVISFLGAKGLMLIFAPVLGRSLETLPETMSYTALFTLLFYVINHTFVDLVLLIRPQPYRFRDWKQKTTVESVGMMISIVYLGLFFLLGNQNRGEVVDIFSFFFFFSPLVALSLIGASNVKLRREKDRLLGLVNLNEDLNERIPDKKWLAGVEKNLSKLFEYDGIGIWTKEGSTWINQLSLGIADPKKERTNLDSFEEKYRELTLAPSPIQKDEQVRNSFHPYVKTAVLCPLKVEGDTAGFILIGKTRSGRIRPEESKMMKALVNQLEVLMKGRSLIDEREHRMILQERNRIAREIHDGIAQSVAAAVMKLEVAKRQAPGKPDKAFELLHQVIPELRSSLSEIRESIYALRPFPTEEHGLVQALKEEADRVRSLEKGTQITLTIKGDVPILKPEKEKLVYTTFKESVQNALKHAGTASADIVLTSTEDEVILEVSDAGVGFVLKEALIKARKGKHFGIVNMSEEAGRNGASFQIDSEAGKGTKITLSVPADR
ncbi:histidine kinase [Alteribacter keqinensis]|uniref:histidine kinase n=1 Tax=Alteribacter keqinensis TaxID=2483800 RepID=A0A3M7TL85_9BACI|nr:histidine kinase [Alteribacter keqinensis]RNA66297.1 hypothetical protein EBO34_19455 [Alteribacter keqinensis]